MKRILHLLIFTALFTSVSAQKYFTRDGKVTFFSDAPLEKIEAVNHKVASVLNTENGDLEFAVLIKSFHFEKALMEEHFNENYLESSKYPKATFKGKIVNPTSVNFKQSGKYSATVKGDLTIHGVTKPVEVTGTFISDGQNIQASSVFEAIVADYEIEIPKVVRDNIAKTVEIRVEIDYKPLDQ